MKTLTLSTLIFFLTILISCDRDKGENQSTMITVNDLQLNIEVIQDDIVHVVWKPDSINRNPESLIVHDTSSRKVTYHKKDSGDFVLIQTDKIKLLVNRLTGDILFQDQKGRRLLMSEQPAFSALEDGQHDQSSLLSFKQHFTFGANEALYGLGQYQDGTFNYRGEEILLTHSNTCAAVPFLLSSNKYGILWDNYSKTIFNDRVDNSYIWSEAGKCVNYYFVSGNSMDEVISGYRSLTGKAPILPKWAYGYWQSKEHYETGEELLEIASRYRRKELPIDVIVQDWSYWGKQELFSGMVWDDTAFPNPEQTIETLHSKHDLHLMISIWPAFGKESDIYAKMDAKDFLFPKKHWSPSRVYDAYNPEARSLYWKYIKNSFYDIGVDGWWLDGTEPEFMHTGDRYITARSMKQNGEHHLGSFTEYLNTYSYFTCKGVYENQLADDPDNRVCILTRSAFAGQQKYAAITWSGDIFANWNVLKNQITSGLNFCLAGIPYWTSDIGAFITRNWFPEGINDPSYRELYVRWFQYGAFCPIFRSHGTDTPREVWRFGEPGSEEYEALSDAIDLRYKLMPYIYSLAGKTYFDDYTIMRGLPLDFADDARALETKEQFMFGPSILVCPVTKATQYPQQRVSEFIPFDRFYSTDGSSKGMACSFIPANSDDESQHVSLQCENPNLTWFGAVPEQLKDKPYDVIYKGKIKSLPAGKYKFIIKTDGGVTLTIADNVLIDQPNNTRENTFHGTIELDSATLYEIDIKHSQPKANHANFNLEWTKPGHLEEIYSENGKKKIYLPGNHIWYDFWSGDEYKPQQDIVVQTTLKNIPLFIQGGTILPMNNPHQSSFDQPYDTLEIRVYPGADARFDLYDDNGNDNSYIKGHYTKVPLLWDDTTKQFTIGKHSGNKDLPEKVFKIINMRETKYHGPTSKGDYHIVEYKGKEIKINL